MAEDKQAGGGFPGTNWALLAVAAVSAAYIGLKKPPLDVLRPDGSDRAIHDTRGIQDVAARLWQDPLDAVSQSAQAEKKDPVHASHRVLHSLAEFKTKVANTQLILGVGLSGEHYAEEAEARRRSRFAVLAALNAAHYVPDDEEHIGYVRTDDLQQNQFRMEWNQPDLSVSFDVNTASNQRSCNDGLCEGNSEKNSAFHTVIPFEGFHKAASPGKSRDIVVVWIDEEILARRDPHPHASPLASLRQLLGELGVSGSPGSGPRFALIGPQASTALGSLVQEARTDGAGKGKELLKKVSIYNSGATITGEEAIAVDDPNNKASITFHELFRKLGIHYYPTISTDDAVVKALIAELKRRGVDPSHTTTVRTSSDDGASIDRHLDHIAVVSEWDTLYGQSWPNTIQRCFSSPLDPATATCPATNSEKDWIHRFSYLRGLDGQVPHPASAKAPNSEFETTAIRAIAGTTEVTTPNANDNLESAFGQGQFDYLRRLADRIRATDSDLRRSGEGHIAAIGVLGSDVYDKLVILEALRPEFPDVLFFTTDLDERLLTRGKSYQTRGLLVASSFGLNLRDAVQKDIPPFRNVYQTSTFLATRLAIENEGPNLSRPDLEKTKNALKKWLKPVLFQIDRTAFFRLPVGEDEPSLSEDPEKEEKACEHDPLDCKYIQPKIDRIFPDYHSRSLLFGIASIVAIATIALAMCSRQIRQFCFPSPPPGRSSTGLTVAGSARCIGLSVAVFGLATVAVALWPRIADILTQHGSGEPMLLLQGISIWPTILFRIVSFGLCVWFIWLTLRSLEKNSEDTDAALRLRPLNSLFKSPQFRQKGRTLRQRLSATLSLRPLPHPLPATGEPPPEFAITNFRVRFAYEGLPGPRIVRAAVATIFMMSIGTVLAVIFGFPNVPARGSIARHLYNIVTPLDVFATILLVFLVIDATLYARSFVILLSSVRSQWPQKTVQHFKNQLRMRSGDLDDWIDLQYLVRRTSCITNLVYLPFVMMAVLVITRNPAFDSFTYPPSLIIVQLATVAIIVASVYSLRRAADAERAIAVERLTGKLVAAKGMKNEGRTAQLELLLNRVENLRDGAFAPWSSQPIVRAFLLPLMTYGATTIVQIYALPGL